MVAALCKEMALQKEFLRDEIVSTVYFGGGTPSLLSVDDCALLLMHYIKILALTQMQK